METKKGIGRVVVYNKEDMFDDAIQQLIWELFDTYLPELEIKVHVKHWTDNRTDSNYIEAFIEELK